MNVNENAWIEQNEPTVTKWVFTQNNSGGSYDYPEWTGPADLGGVFAAYDWQDQQVDVWVMAESEEEANRLAEQYAGVYFDGVEKGLDCDCCGDRWYPAQD
jgi:hypothetical protein